MFHAIVKPLGRRTLLLDIPEPAALHLPAVSAHDSGARQTLAAFKSRADRRLEALAAEWIARAASLGDRAPTPVDLVRSVTDLTGRGGKRVRPALAYHAALCFDHGLDDGALLDATLSVEVLQSYLLIHDDLMDRDPVRRGGPSAHEALSTLANDRGVGEALAVLAGDLGCAMAQELLLGDGLPPSRALAATRELARMQWEVILGQHLDIVGGAPSAVVHDLKTASYTTRGPVRLGAALAGAEAEALGRLTRYGTPLGVAFQVRDDLLGTFGKPDDLGKPVGADLRAGKRTALVELALERATGPGRKALEAVLGDPAAPDEAVAAACAVIEETGTRRDCEERVSRLTGEALAALEGCAFREEGLSFLRGLALLLADRDR